MTATERELQRIAAQTEKVSAQLLAEGGGSFEASHGATALYCPFTRKPCMRRLCAAAERRQLGRLATVMSGATAEWTCSAFGGCVVDHDTDEASGVRDQTSSHLSAPLPTV